MQNNGFYAAMKTDEGVQAIYIDEGSFRAQQERAAAEQHRKEVKAERRKQIAAMTREQRATIRVLKQELKLIGMGLPVILAGGVALAIGQWKLLKQGLSGTRTLFSLYLLPIVLPSALVVFFIKILLPFDMAPAVVWLMVGLYIWKNIPYALLAAFLGLRNLPEGVQDAARVDGANGWQMLRHITLPFLKPYILVGAVLALLGIFRIFRESYLLFGNYPDQSVYYLQNYMNNLFYASNYGQLAAASEIFLAAVSVLLRWWVPCTRPTAG